MILLNSNSFCLILDLTCIIMSSAKNTYFFIPIIMPLLYFIYLFVCLFIALLCCLGHVTVLSLSGKSGKIENLVWFPTQRESFCFTMKYNAYYRVFGTFYLD